MSRSRRRATAIDDAAAGRAALVRLLRFVLVVMIVLVAFFYVLDIGENASELGDWEITLVTGWPWVLLFALTLAFGVIAVDVLTPEKKIATVSGVFFGIVAGVVAAVALSYLLDRLAEAYEVQGSRIISSIKILIGIAAVYLSVSIVLQTQDQFRLVIPYVEFARQIRGPRPLLLDTSALIDARILDLGRTGLLQTPIMVPRFVVDELQSLADSQDRLKRGRGRRGLDTVTALQRHPGLDVTIEESDAAGAGVDQQIVDLAGRLPATIVTTDSGLGRVAAIKNVAFVNLNEVAAAMRLNLIPGDTIDVRIVRAGEQPEQGVGYLDDGTMVVVEDGADLIGDAVPVRVTNSLQTNSGRLVFARAKDDGHVPARSAVPKAPPSDHARVPDAGASDAESPPTSNEPPVAPPARRRDPRQAKARNPRR